MCINDTCIGFRKYTGCFQKQKGENVLGIFNGMLGLAIALAISPDDSE